MESPPSGTTAGNEEAERQSLVSHNGFKPDSALEIDPHAAPISGHRGGFFSGRRCLLLFAVLIFLLIVVLIFASRKAPIKRINFPLLDRMRESELRALYLLQNQQAGLLDLWNRTRPAAAAAAPAGPDQPSVAALGGFKSALLEQIKLNKQIQNALLSSHSAGNSSSDASTDTADFDISGLALDLCKRVNRTAARKTIEWKPKTDRFLFAICVSGQMSNHLICLEKHMFIAALLDRVLILPSPKVDYQYDEVLDVSHINGCFGRQVVIPFDDFAKSKKNTTKIDRLICYITSPPCYMDKEHFEDLKGMGLSLPKIEVAWPGNGTVETQKKRVAGDITSKFSSDDEVIAIGDMFYADVEEEWVMQPGGPLAHKCKVVTQPSRVIYLTAQRFVQTFLGRRFVAVHFRRHGFLKFCNLKNESCFFPIPQAAECILRVLEKGNTPVVYLSTDAAESEIKLLRSMLLLDGKHVPLITRPDHDNADKWDALLYRNNLAGDDQVEAMLDKTICATSTVFIGSSGSTFTEDIMRLRRGWGFDSLCDEYLCEGEQPNFIAENE